VLSGVELADTIERTRACSLSWLLDGTGFSTQRYPAAGSVPAVRRRTTAASSCTASEKTRQ